MVKLALRMKNERFKRQTTLLGLKRRCTMVKKQAAMKEVYAADHLEMQSHIRRYTRERDEIQGKPAKK